MGEYKDIKPLQKKLNRINTTMLLGTIGMIFPWIYSVLYVLENNIEIFGSVQNSTSATVLGLFIFVVPIIVICYRKAIKISNKLRLLKIQYDCQIYHVRLYPNEEQEFIDLINKALELGENEISNGVKKATKDLLTDIILYRHA